MVPPVTASHPASRAQRLAIGLGTALVAAFVASTLWTLLLAHWPGVYTDMWDELPFLQRLEQGRATLHDWANAYAGSHRLLLPRAVFAIEHQLFHHANAFTTAVSLLLQLASIALVVRLLLAGDHPATPLRQALALLVIACGLSALQLYNLLYAFLVQWFQVVAFSFAAFAVLIGSAASARATRAAVLAFVLALLASFCNFPGVIALLTLGLLGIALRLPRPLGLLLLATCVLAVAAHVATLPDAGIDRSALLAHVRQQPLVLLAYPIYALRFLGMPLTLLHEPAGMLLGLLVLGWTAWQGLRWLRTGLQPSLLAAFALAGLLWLCGTAVATALGRGLVPVTAVAERFHTVHLWILPLLLVHMACTLRRPWAHQGVLLATVLAGLMLLPLQAAAIRQALQTAQKVQMAHIAYSVGLRDWRTHPLLSIPHRAAKRNPALEWRDYLQQTGNGIFARQAAHWPGQYFSEDPSRLPPCPATITLAPLGGGFAELQAGLPATAGHPQAAWLLDANGRVIGYALREMPASLRARPANLRGYTREQEPWWLVTEVGDTACLLGQSAG